jgi:hypothetical protein
LRFFKLQMGNRTNNVSTLRLKACKSPPDIAVAQPPRRGRPPAAARPPACPPAARPPAARRRVTFACPAATIIRPATSSSSPSPTPRLYQSGRPARSAGPPARYTVSLVHRRCPRLGGDLLATTHLDDYQPFYR